VSAWKRKRAKRRCVIGALFYGIRDRAQGTGAEGLKVAGFGSAGFVEGAVGMMRGCGCFRCAVGAELPDYRSGDAVSI
jgi:hypothetical protein